MDNELTLMATSEVVDSTGLSRMQIKNLCEDGRFPLPLEIGSKVKYYCKNSVEFCMRTMHQGLTIDEQRAVISDHFIQTRQMNKQRLELLKPIDTQVAQESTADAKR